MRKFIVIVCLLLFCTVAFAEDSKEVMTLKRDVLAERIMRIKSEQELMKIQFTQSNEALVKLTAEFKEIQEKLQPAEKAKEKK